MIVGKSELLLNNSRNYNESNPTVLLKQLFEELNKSDTNVSASESRTLSSWLGLNRFRRPQFQYNKPFGGPAHKPSSPNSPYIAPPIFPQFPSRPNSFPGPHDPDSLLLPPSLFEESGVKYWLEFIENAGKDDNREPEEYSSRPIKPIRKPSYFRPSANKPIDIGEKPNEENDDFFDDNEENDDQNEELNEENKDYSETTDEPKSSGSASSQSKNTYDTTPRCDKFTEDICVDDFEYPEQAIVDEIYKRRDIFELMYSEVRDNVPLVDGIPRDVEESYSSDYYYDNKDPQTSSSGHGKTDKRPGHGFVCPTEVLYGKPKLARNKRGDWKVIVNAAEFTQTVRMEKCLKPNNKCNYISYPDFDSRCAQVHSYHRLLVFEKGKGFYIDTFRIPTACTCHVNRKVTYKPQVTASQTQTFHKKQRPSPSPALSNTLWSILGGNLPNDKTGGFGGLGQSQELIKNQINLLQQMKHFPQLAHISPENVFQQLMDFQTNSERMSIPQKNYQTPPKSDSLSFSQSDIDYIIPGLVVNDGQSSSERRPQNQMTASLAQIHQNSGTTTLLNPNANGAPIVQVIHVPVTSAIAQPNRDPVPVYKSQSNPTFNDYSYLDSSSLFNKQNSNEFLQTFGEDLSNINVDNFKPMLMGMSSKTNSSLMSPNSERGEHIKRGSDMYSRNSDFEETNKKRELMVEKALNKKINFSYHPILEYISR